MAAYRGDKKLGKSSDSANEGVRFTRMESISLCRHLMSVHTRGTFSSADHETAITSLQ